MGMHRKNLAGAEVEIEDLKPGGIMDQEPFHVQAIKNSRFDKTLFHHHRGTS
jgi:hypothetical protein